MDETGGKLVGDLCQRADAFLFGRWTYETFAAFWGAIDDPGNPIATAFNTRPKHVALTTLTEATWTDTTVLRDDATIADVRSTPDGELQVHGSPTSVRRLLAAGLVDEAVLLRYPVILGQGARLFPDAGPDLALDLIETSTTGSGVTVQAYRPAGRPRYAN